MTQTETVMRDKLQKQVEIALKVAQVAYWEYDVANEIFIFNDNAYDILRTTLEKEGSYHIPATEYMARFVHPDDVGILTGEIRRAFKFTDPDFTSDQEYRTIWGDGQPGYLHILFKAERDEDGRVTRLYGTGQDITQRRQNEDALVKRAAKTEALLSLTRVASGSLDLEAILDEALTQALTITGFDAGLITMINPETQLLELRSHRLPDTLLKPLQENGFDNTLCDLVYRRQEPVIVTDLSEDSPMDVTGLLALGYQSYQGVPVAAKGQIMGTVCLFGHTRLTREETDIDLLQAVGQQVGFAIRNAALFEQTQSSETRYRTLFDSAADGIEVLDTKGVITDCNETHLQTLGYSRDEVIGQHTTQFFTAESAKYFKQLSPQIIEMGSAERELEMTRQDGSVVHIWRKAQAVYDTDGQIVNIVAYNRDITERKSAEATLHEAQARAQIILDAVTTPLLISKLSDGLILYANELLADMIQLPLDDLIGDVTPDFYFDPADRPKLLTLLSEQGAAADYELQLKRGSGEPFWASISIKVFDFQGEAALITTFLDVAERKQMTLDLQKAQARSQFILESVTLPLLVSRIKDGTVMYANDRIAEMVGVAPEDVMGNQTPDFYHNPEDRMEILNAVREHGGIDNKELALKRADGKLLWAILSNRLVDFEGEPAIITTLIDITARKEAEEALARRAAEFEMVSHVSASAATILETDKLLQEVIDLTKARFNLYHAHIYLLNANGDALVLTAGAGEVGQQMVGEGRSIALNQEQSLVAQAARASQGVTENDVRENPAFLPHPLLPNTRAEMAAPMIVGDRVIGVLDVQSDEVGRFTEQDVMISTTLAAQIAVALENARSFEKAQAAVANLNEITRRLTREGWQDYLNDLPVEVAGFVYDPARLNPMEPVTEAMAEETAVNGAAEIAQSLSQAITVHGEAIGQLTVVPDEADEQEMAEIITAVTEQLSARIENLRLTDQTQAALTEAERQGVELALINQVVTEVAASLDLQESMQIVATELARAISVEQVAITLLNEARTEATVVAEYFGESEYEKALGVVFSLADNLLTQQVIDTREPVIVTDAQRNSRTAPIHDVMRARGTQTLALLPMTAGNEVIGTVGIDILDENRVLHEKELRLAETLIFQAATAVQNAKLFNQTQQALDETEEQARRLAQLNQMSAALNQAGTLTDMYEIAVRETPKVLPTERVSLTLLHESSDYFEVVAFWGEEAEMPVGARLSSVDSPLLIAIKENRIVHGSAESGIESALFAPLFVSGRAIGTLNIGGQRIDAYGARDEQLLRQVAVLAGSSIENMRLLENEQNRAQREQTLREIAEKVRSSADVETIMRTAVQEAGRILGRRTFIYLEDKPSAQE